MRKNGGRSQCPPLLVETLPKFTSTVKPQSTKSHCSNPPSFILKPTLLSSRQTRTHRPIACSLTVYKPTTTPLQPARVDPDHTLRSAPSHAHMSGSSHAGAGLILDAAAPIESLINPALSQLTAGIGENSADGGQRAAFQTTCILLSSLADRRSLPASLSLSSLCRRL